MSVQIKVLLFLQNLNLCACVSRVFACIGLLPPADLL